MRELWKDAVYDGVTYEGYQVSNLGRVKSLNYNHTGKEKVMKLLKRVDGYLQIGLHKDEKYKMIKVHRLVASVFIENPNNLPDVNHKDENKTNNVVDNLEWCDRKYNNNYGNHNRKVGEALMNGKCSKPVLQYTLNGDLIREWSSTHECGRNGFNQGNISACCNGERKTHKGYIWKYK